MYTPANIHTYIYIYICSVQY